MTYETKAALLALEAWAEKQNITCGYSVARMAVGGLCVGIHTGSGEDNTFSCGYGYADTIGEALEIAKKDFHFVPNEQLGQKAEPVP